MSSLQFLDQCFCLEQTRIRKPPICPAISSKRLLIPPPKNTSGLMARQVVVESRTMSAQYICSLFSERQPMSLPGMQNNFVPFSYAVLESRDGRCCFSVHTFLDTLVIPGVTSKSDQEQIKGFFLCVQNRKVSDLDLYRWVCLGQ